MATRLLSDKYGAELHGVLNCYDRVVITGNVHPLCYAKGMTKYLYMQHIRIFDFAKFVEPLRDAIRANAQAIAKEHGLEIEFVRKSLRKADRVRKLLETSGDQPGLVHIFSAMEQCTAYYPWHDKGTGKTFIKSHQGKRLHDYSSAPNTQRVLHHGFCQRKTAPTSISRTRARSAACSNGCGSKA